MPVLTGAIGMLEVSSAVKMEAKYLLNAAAISDVDDVVLPSLFTFGLAASIGIKGLEVMFYILS